MASDAIPLRTQSTCLRLDRDERHREFIDFVSHNARDGINGLDETAKFITPSLVKGWWAKPGERRIPRALNPGRTYTAPDTILKGYTIIFSILVYISRTQFIGDFVRHRFGDQQLPLLEHSRHQFGDDPAMTEMLSEFCDNQWKFTPTIFSIDEGMNITLIDKRQILPIKTQRLLPTTTSTTKSIIRVVTLYPDCCPPEWGPESTVVFKEYQTQKNEGFRYAWNSEYSAFASIESCEYIIKYLGSFEQNDRCFMMLEYAEGGSLLDLFKGDKFPHTHDELMHFWSSLMGLFKAINRIHNLGNSSDGEHTGFAHRDINPANILVFFGEGGPEDPFSRGFKLKLADFDTATTLRSIDETGLSPVDNDGTRAPQASRVFPEQERDMMLVPLSCDVWSLGCVLSEALVWLAGGWQAVEAAAKDRQTTIAREHPQMKGSGYDCSFHDGTNVLPCVISSHRKAVDKLGHEDILSQKVCHLIEGRILLPEDSRPFQHNPMSIWTAFDTKIRSSITSVYNPTSPKAFFHDRPVSEPPKTLTPDGSPSSPGSSTRDKALSPGGSPSYISNGVSHEPDPTVLHATNNAVNPQNRISPIRPGHLATHVSSNNDVFISSPAGPNSLGIAPSSGSAKAAFVHSTYPFKSSLPRPRNPTRQSPVEPSNDSTGSGVDTPNGEATQAQQPNPQSNPDLYPTVTVDDVITHRQDRGKREDLKGYKSFKRSCKRRHFMFIIDDSESMRKMLNEVSKTADALLWILKDIDFEGVELRFTSDPTRRHPGMFLPIWRRSTDTLVRKIRDWFKADEADRFCNMELSLDNIFNDDKAVDLKRPTSVLILTDGIWEGGDELGGGLEANISRVVKQMEKKGIPRTGFTIQFVSFGNDPAGISRLKYLDDDAPFQNKKGKKVDIVDHKSSKASVWPILIGAMSEGNDSAPGPEPVGESTSR
ncbi:hypothetical protein FDECE_3596 [Fusarium decemcellulare]|nr:hypothetical protein FDECE_3596 [Fusarium decemcellulare]